MLNRTQNSREVDRIVAYVAANQVRGVTREEVLSQFPTGRVRDGAARRLGRLIGDKAPPAKRAIQEGLVVNPQAEQVGLDVKAVVQIQVDIEELRNAWERRRGANKSAVMKARKADDADGIIAQEDIVMLLVARGKQWSEQNMSRGMPIIVVTDCFVIHGLAVR